jgi:MoxR-like ATPase
MSTSPTNKKFVELRTALNARHFERYDEIDITLTALLAGFHVALIGPPGTAKSMLVEDLTTAFQGEVFKYLLTKYTTPEELYGPVDLKALTEDSVYRRVTTNKLPEAEFAFLDEVFKANSAVLNTTLTAMNERQFDNGTGREDIPLITVIGASNELPEGDELNAMFDRFHFRKVVDYIREPSNFIGMLQYNPDDTDLPTLTFDELIEAQDEVSAISVPDETTDTIYDIRADLGLEGIIPSDRRFRQSVKALQAFAWLNERDTASDSDFTILQHMFWAAPQEMKPVSRVILTHTNPIELEAQEVMDLIDDIAQKLNSAVKKAKSDPEEATNLAKQGIEWFTRTKKFGDTLKKLQAKADKQDRVVPKIEQARNRLVEVARAIGQQTIGLDTFENFEV